MKTHLESKIRAENPLLILMTHMKIGDFLILTPHLQYLQRIYPKWMIAVPDTLWELYSEQKLFHRQISSKDVIGYLWPSTQILDLSYPLIKDKVLPKNHFFLNGKYFKKPQHSSVSYTESLHEYFPELPLDFAAKPFLDFVIDQKVLDKQNLKPMRYFTVHSGSDFSAKNWAPENFETTVEMALKRFPEYKCVSIVGPQDDELFKAKPKPENFISFKSSLRDVAHVLSGSLFHIDNDSGIHHLAGVLDVPSITIFGPTGPGTWKSLTPHNFIHWGGPACAHHCEGTKMTVCPDKVCLSSIKPEQVLVSATRILCSEVTQA